MIRLLFRAPMPSRRTLLALGLAAAAAPAAAQTDPARQLARAVAQEPGLRLVRTFYAPGFDARRIPFARRLRPLVESVVARSRREEAPVAGLDFGWTIGAREAEEGFERTLALRTLAQTIGSAVVEARFRNGRPQVVQYRVVREEGRWVVDDIEYVTGREKLSALLQRGARGAT